jgi:hypothetical protein
VRDAEKLAKSRRGYVIAPAGCGKTHLIAVAIQKYCSGRELILTHTHAGVAALKQKLSGLGVAPSAYHVDTIAGWALRLAAHFPETSGLVTFTPSGKAWNQVYGAAIRILSDSPVREIVSYSYSGVFVDEYQDCIMGQHNLVVELAKLIPCRILGDPLQGIFDFAGRTVDWDEDIPISFDRLPELSKPWRWKGKNEELGSWLQTSRGSLLRGEPLQLDGSPVKWIESPPNKAPYIQMKACHDIANDCKGSVVAIQKWPRDCHAVASRLKGRYFVIEAIDCKDLMDSADAIYRTTGPERAYQLLEFASKCMTKVGPELRPACQCFLKGKSPNISRSKCRDQIVALECVASSGDISYIHDCLLELSSLSGARIYRKELLDEMLRSLKEFETGEYETLRDAAWAVRDRTRHLGRRLGRGTVGTTLLIKGLEFDHAIVLDADKLGPSNLYVAMTRGSQSLTVLSKKPTIKP